MPTQIESLLFNCSDVGQMIVDKLKVNAATIGVGPADVYYGDRPLLPNLPSITVEVFDSPWDIRPFKGVDIEFGAYIMAYFGRIDDSSEQNRKASDEFAEGARDILNSDPQWKNGSGNQQLVYGWVTRNQPGYAVRGPLLYAARLTWQAKSKTIM